MTIEDRVKKMNNLKNELVAKKMSMVDIVKELNKLRDSWDKK